MIILFGGDLVRSFFPSRPQYAILGTGILGQIASFERRLRGKTPLAPRISSASGRDRVRGLSETSEKCAIFCIFGGIRPNYSFLDLGIYTCRA